VSYTNEVEPISGEVESRIMDIDWQDNCPLCSGELGWTCKCAPETLIAYFFAREEIAAEIRKMTKRLEIESRTRSMTDSKMIGGQLMALREVERLLTSVKKLKCEGCEAGDGPGMTHRGTCNKFSWSTPE
jgi:hypothetical protein